MELTIWLKDVKTTLFIGGDVEKGKPPVVTAKLDSAQILIEPDKYKVTILETGR
jgi:hypothetical protein